jgi:hypothetical protein
MACCITRAVADASAELRAIAKTIGILVALDRQRFDSFLFALTTLRTRLETLPRGTGQFGGVCPRLLAGERCPSRPARRPAVKALQNG